MTSKPDRQGAPDDLGWLLGSNAITPIQFPPTPPFSSSMHEQQPSEASPQAFSSTAMREALIEVLYDPTTNTYDPNEVDAALKKIVVSGQASVELCKIAAKHEAALKAATKEEARRRDIDAAYEAGRDDERVENKVRRSLRRVIGGFAILLGPGLLSFALTGVKTRDLPSALNDSIKPYLSILFYIDDTFSTDEKDVTKSKQPLSTGSSSAPLPSPNKTTSSPPSSVVTKTPSSSTQPTGTRTSSPSTSRSATASPSKVASQTNTSSTPSTKPSISTSSITR